MNRSKARNSAEVPATPAEIVREYGPLIPGAPAHGVTHDGRSVWVATGARLVAFDPEQRRGRGARLEVEQGAGDEVGEDAHGLDRGGPQPGTLEQGLELIAGEAVSGAAGVAARGARVEEVAGGLEVTGHGPGDDGRVTLGDQQAEVAAGAQHPGDGRQRGGGVVDDLEHAVAQDQVDAAGLDEAGEVAEVALLAGDPVGDAALPGPPVEGGEGVGAGVDDPDVVTQLGQRDGEPAGAAADVDDPGLRGEVGGPQHLADR